MASTMCGRPDPYNWFDETTRVDNTTWAKIGISGNTVTTAA